MVGRHVESYEEFWSAREPGSYCKVERKSSNGEHLAWVWYAITPNGHLGNLEKHEVTENEDGTITVSPSILVEAPGTTGGYHGHLVAGVWSP